MNVGFFLLALNDLDVRRITSCEFLCQLLDFLVLRRGIKSFDRRLNLRVRCDNYLDAMPREKTEFIQGCQVVRVGNRDREDRTLDADGDGQVFPGNVLGNEFDRRDIDFGRV